MRTPRSLAVITIAALIAPLPLEVLAQETKTSTPASPPTSTPAPPPAPAPASKDSKDKAAAAAAPAAEAKFTASQLEQMAAPIALYPDSLLMQILMASTYPLEVVEAARWLEAHPELKDEKKIDEALKKEEWDPSVKSIVKFPDILKKMNKNLDWTRDIGDAFLGQQAELLDGVQRLRGKAHEAGNLKSGKEQTVTVQEDKTIIIQQANPEVIYVPTYNPTVVYGPYWPPPVYYPSMYYYPPGAAMFAFSVGFMWGAAMWGGCSWGWGHSNVNVNVNHYNNFNRNTNINGGNNINNGNNNINGGNRNQVNPNNKGGAGGGTQNWNHNPEHRKGVNYKDNKTAQQFGGNGANPRVSQSDARGFNQGGGRPSTGNSAGGAGGTGARPSTGNRAGGAGGTGARPSTGNVGSSSRPSTSNRSSSAFSGSRNSSFDRAASSRGMSSRSGGGGARAGGGGGGRRR